ncbi:MAG: hypothetical protein PHT32_02400, partial [Candidatus Omnitrophica bacterium]|nr:hypothetical protein [Candidatus Omnitrophota bacterium]
VSPEDKKKFMDGLDNKIESCKEALKVNPYDKKSKNLLAMSESLKKLVSIEFNYKPGAKRPNDKAAR